MAQAPGPVKLFQIEEPDGTPLADAPGVAVGIELSRDGAAVAAAIGGNGEWLVTPDRGGGLGSAPEEPALTELLGGLRATAEKALSRPVTHAVVRLDGVDIADPVLLRAAAAAGIALLGIRRDGNGIDAAIEAEELAQTLSH